MRTSHIWLQTVVAFSTLLAYDNTGSLGSHISGRRHALKAHGLSSVDFAESISVDMMFFFIDIFITIYFLEREKPLM